VEKSWSGEEKLKEKRNRRRGEERKTDNLE
jgi:hypothetical protein